MKRQKISRAIDHLDETLIADALAEKTNKNRGGYSMKTMWKKWVAAAAAFAIILTAVLVIANSGGSSSAVIAFDVNPSLEIEVNENKTVKKVTALNEDARKVIGEMSFEGDTLDKTVNALIGSMLLGGYLSVERNSILISVDSENSDTATKLQASLTESVAALLKNSNIEASVLTQNYTHGDTTAKEALIAKILAAGVKTAAGDAYTKEQLEALNINELKLILDSKEVKLDGVESTGNASESKFIGRDAALALALEAAGASASSTERSRVELDYEDDLRKMLYEVEFTWGDFEYEYEIDAESGEILHFHSEPRDFEDKFEDIFDIFDEDDDNQPIPEGCITRAEAIAIALNHAGVSEADVRDIDCDFEKGWFGRYTFEVSFETPGREFEYEINAKTGEIRRHHSERDD